MNGLFNTILILISFDHVNERLQAPLTQFRHVILHSYINTRSTVMGPQLVLRKNSNGQCRSLPHPPNHRPSFHTDLIKLLLSSFPSICLV